RFNDQVWLDRPNQLLHGDDVLGILDNRASQPREIVGILRDRGRLGERASRGHQRRIPPVLPNPRNDFLVEWVHASTGRTGSSDDAKLTERQRSSFRRSPQNAIGS